MQCTGTLPAVLAAICLPAADALAKNRPVTLEEWPRLEAAVTAAGCSDGKKYDLTFDPSFNLLVKKLD